MSRILKIMVLVLFSQLPAVAQQPLPTPPIKPSPFSLAHQEVVLSRLAIRLGMDFLGPAHFAKYDMLADAIDAFLEALAPESAYLPVWANEITAPYLITSLDQLVKCRVTATDMPAERPPSVKAVFCIDVKYPDGKTVPGIFLADTIEPHRAYGRAYVQHTYGWYEWLNFPTRLQQEIRQVMR